MLHKKLITKVKSTNLDQDQIEATPLLMIINHILISENNNLSTKLR